MAYEKIVDLSLDYMPCRYAGSKLLFRGPRRSLKGNYAAFLGGTDTYGKFIRQPFPALVEKEAGLRCVNFGWPNAGVDVFLNDPGVQDAARKARAVVLQLPCAQNMTNRFYSVHPRRNDRFLEASPVMRAIFQEVDFTEFHFTRHMISRLQQVAPERFHVVREELQSAWVARMRLLLQRLGNHVVLLWFSARRPGENDDSPDLAVDPAFVSRPMVEAVRGHAVRLVEVYVSPHAQGSGTDGMVFSQFEAGAAAELLNLKAHDQASGALVPVIRDILK